MKEPPAQISSNDWGQYLQSQLLRHKVVHAGQGVIQLRNICTAAHGAVGLATRPKQREPLFGEPRHF